MDGDRILGRYEFCNVCTIIYHATIFGTSTRPPIAVHSLSLLVCVCVGGGRGKGREEEEEEEAIGDGAVTEHIQKKADI